MSENKDPFSYIPFESDNKTKEKKEKNEVRIEHTENGKWIKIMIPGKPILPIEIRELKNAPLKTINKILKIYKDLDQELNKFEKQKLLEKINDLLSSFLNEEKKKEEKEEVKGETLVYEDEKTRIEVKANDGVFLYPSSLFYKSKDNVLIGTFFFAFTKKEDKEEEEEFETTEPIVLWAIHTKDGVKREWKPLTCLDKIVIEDRPIIIKKEWELIDVPIKTLISYDAVLRFLKGENSKPIKELYEDVINSQKKFINYSWDERLYDLSACWVIATYFFEIFSAFPHLYFYGSIGTGKTRANMTITYISRYGFFVTNPSDPILYRFSQIVKPTMGVDERVIGPTAWNIIRSAFKKGVSVPRMEVSGKGKFKLRFFEPYTSWIFSSTQLPSDLGGEEADESRGIFITMQQAPDPIGRDPEPEDFQTIRDELYLFRLLKINEVLKAYQEVKSQDLGLYGREKEVWLPLFTIAHLVGVLDKIKSLAKELYEVKSQKLYEEEKTILKAIRKLYEFDKEEKEKTKKLVEEEKKEEEKIKFLPSILKNFIKQVLEEEGVYEEKLFPKLWSAEKIGRALSKMKIYKRRIGKGCEYILSIKEYNELCNRYGLIDDMISVGSVGIIKGTYTKPDHQIDEKTMESVGSVGSVGSSGIREKKIFDNEKKEISEFILELPTQHTQPTLEHQTNEKLMKKTSVGSFDGTYTTYIRTCENCKCFNKDASFCLLTNTLTTPTSACDNWTLKEVKQDEGSQEEKKETKGQEAKQDPGFTCKDCKHYITSNNKCSKHPEWIFISPFSKPCELLEKRDDEK